MYNALEEIIVYLEATEYVMHKQDEWLLTGAHGSFLPPKRVNVPMFPSSTWRLEESLLVLPLRSSAPSVAPDV